MGIMMKYCSNVEFLECESSKEASEFIRLIQKNNKDAADGQIHKDWKIIQLAPTPSINVYVYFVKLSAI